MVLEYGKAAPYAPPSAIIDVIEGYRDKGLTTPFDPDVLVRAGVSGSLAPRTMAALKLLDLVDEDGKPTAPFHELKTVPTDEFKGRFAGLLRDVYAEVFSFADPATDTPEKITDAFRGFTPDGQRGRMVTLFIGLCQYAEIIDADAPAATPAKPTRSKQTLATRTQRSKKPKGTQGRGGDSTPPPPPAGPQQSFGDLDPALAGLLSGLPKRGAGWTAERRDSFIQAFTNVLDFLYPTGQQPAATPDSSAGDEEDDES